MSLDKVEFYINEQLVSYITSYTLSWDLFQSAGSFTADIAHDYNYHLGSQPYTFEWKINGQTVMTGYLDRVTRTYSKGSFDQTVMGRDMCQLLIDNDVIVPTVYVSSSAVSADYSSDVDIHPVDYNSNIDHIIKDIIDLNREVTSLTTIIGNKSNVRQLPRTMSLPISSKNIKFTTTALQRIKEIGELSKFRTQYGQTLFSAMQNLANMAGLYIMADPSSLSKMDIVINNFNASAKTPLSYGTNGSPLNDKPYEINNILPTSSKNNVISANYTTDINKYYKYIKMVGQTEGINEDTGTLAKSMPKYKLEEIESNSLDKGYKGLIKFNSSEVDTVDEAYWYRTAPSLMDNILLQTNRKLYSAQYMVAGHSPAGAEPYRINHLATINDDYSQFNQTTFLAHKVELMGSKDGGQTARLELCLTSGTDPWASSQGLAPNSEIALGVR